MMVKYIWLNLWIFFYILLLNTLFSMDMSNAETLSATTTKQTPTIATQATTTTKQSPTNATQATTTTKQSPTNATQPLIKIALFNALPATTSTTTTTKQSPTNATQATTTTKQSPTNATQPIIKIALFNAPPATTSATTTTKQSPTNATQATTTTKQSLTNATQPIIKIALFNALPATTSAITTTTTTKQTPTIATATTTTMKQSPTNAIQATTANPTSTTTQNLADSSQAVLEISNQIQALKKRILSTRSGHFLLNLSTINKRKYYISDFEVNSKEADRICKLFKMDLASMETIEENNAVHKQVMAKYGNNWNKAILSGSDEVKQGQWIWRGINKPISYKNFALGEGHDGKRQNCLAYSKQHSNGQWDDISCNNPFNFICETEDTE